MIKQNLILFNKIVFKGIFKSQKRIIIKIVFYIKRISLIIKRNIYLIKSIYYFIQKKTAKL